MTPTADDIAHRLGRTLTPAERTFVETVLTDTSRAITLEFRRVGRDLDAELRADSWLGEIVGFIQLDVAVNAVRGLGREGIRSVTSTTGQQSDSVTYAEVASTGIGLCGLRLRHLELLGISPTGGGVFPPPIRWPEEGRVWKP